MVARDRGSKIEEGIPPFCSPLKRPAHRPDLLAPDREPRARGGVESRSKCPGHRDRVAHHQGDHQHDLDAPGRRLTRRPAERPVLAGPDRPSTSPGPSPAGCQSPGSSQLDREWTRGGCRPDQGGDASQRSCARASRAASPRWAPAGTSPGPSRGRSSIVVSACARARSYTPKISCDGSSSVAHMSAFGSASSSSSHQKVSPSGRSKAHAKQPTSTLARCLTSPSRLVPVGVSGRRSVLTQARALPHHGLSSRPEVAVQHRLGIGCGHVANMAGERDGRNGMSSADNLVGRGRHPVRTRLAAGDRSPRVGPASVAS